MNVPIECSSARNIFDGIPESFLSKEGIPKFFSTPRKLSVEILTVFGSICCCRRG